MRISSWSRTLLLCSLAGSGMALAGSLPSATEIVARYDEALGGRAAILRHTSATMKGTIEVHKPEKVVVLPFVFVAMAPYQRLDRVTLPNQAGDVLSGFDHDAAWGFDPRSGAEVLTGVDHESSKRDADFYYPLDELTWFKSMETVASLDFEGRPCYRLHGINNWNKSNDHFYDRETGLLVGYEFESEWNGAQALTHEIFSDYRKVDGVFVPMKQTFKIQAVKGGDWSVIQVLTYTSVSFNDVDPAVFAPPQAVREILAKPTAHPAGA